MIPIHSLLYYLSSSKKRGFKKLQAICVTMHKLLYAVHAMLKNRTPFDGRRFYTLTGTAAD